MPQTRGQNHFPDSLNSWVWESGQKDLFYLTILIRNNSLKESVLSVSTMLAVVVLEVLVLKGRMPPRGDSHGSKLTIGTLWFLMQLHQQQKWGHITGLGDHTC